jgi:hypothetical protein
MIFPRSKISSSLVNLYLNCPLAFKLTVIDGLEAKEGPALKQGSMFDEAFKAYHQNKDPYEAIRAHVNKLGKKDLWSEPPTKLQIQHMGVVRKLMDKYSLNPQKFKKPNFDVGYGVPLINPTNGEILRAEVSGYLDGLDTDEIIEVKTTSEDWTQERADTELQATMYTYYVYFKYNKLLPVKYIVFNKKNLNIQVFITRRSIDDFANLYTILDKFIDDVEAEKFNRNPNHPYYCSCRELA